MSIKFANEIDRALSEESKHSVALEVRSDTPKPLLDVGLAGLPMYCTRRHIETALGSPDVPHPHNISRQTLETLPELLENPALIVDAMHRPDSVILLTGAKDEIGLPVVAAISTGGRASRFTRSISFRKSHRKLSGNGLFNARHRQPTLWAFW